MIIRLCWVLRCRILVRYLQWAENPIQPDAPIAIRTSYALKNLVPGFLYQFEFQYQPVGEDLYFKTGLEYEYRTQGAGLALRAGYDQSKDRCRWYCGPGRGLGLNVGSMVVDYAWTPYELLGDAHRIFAEIQLWNQPGLARKQKMYLEKQLLPGVQHRSR